MSTAPDSDCDDDPTLSRRSALALCAATAGVGALGGYAYATEPFTDCDPRPLSAAPTEWSFPGYDRGHTRAAPEESAPDGELDVRWRVEWRTDDVGQPVVANGLVLVSVRSAVERVAVRAYDLWSGREHWRGPRTERPDAFDVAAPGDSVFYHADGYERGQFVAALATADGSERWHHAVDSSHSPAQVPSVAAGLVHWAEPRQDGGAVTALDATTGERCWAASLDGWPHSGPASDGERVLYALDDAVVALDATTGAERWRAAVTGYFHPNHDAPDSKINDAVSGRVIVGGGRAFLTTFGGRLLALDATTGEVDWAATSSRTELVEAGERTYGPANFTLGALAGDVLLAVESDPTENVEVLRALAPESGEERWRHEPTAEESLGLASPATAGGTAYVPEYRRSRGGARLLRFAVATGEHLGTVGLGGHAASPPAIADGTVVVATSDGLYALGSD